MPGAARSDPQPSADPCRRGAERGAGPGGARCDHRAARPAGRAFGRPRAGCLARHARRSGDARAVRCTLDADLHRRLLPRAPADRRDGAGGRDRARRHRLAQRARHPRRAGSRPGCRHADLYRAGCDARIGRQRPRARHAPRARRPAAAQARGDAGAADRERLPCRRLFHPHQVRADGAAVAGAGPWRVAGGGQSDLGRRDLRRVVPDRAGAGPDRAPDRQLEDAGPGTPRLSRSRHAARHRRRQTRADPAAGSAGRVAGGGGDHPQRRARRHGAERRVLRGGTGRGRRHRRAVGLGQVDPDARDRGCAARRSRHGPFRYGRDRRLGSRAAGAPYRLSAAGLGAVRRHHQGECRPLRRRTGRGAGDGRRGCGGRRRSGRRARAGPASARRLRSPVRAGRSRRFGRTGTADRARTCRLWRPCAVRARRAQRASRFRRRCRAQRCDHAAQGGGQDDPRRLAQARRAAGSRQDAGAARRPRGALWPARRGAGQDRAAQCAPDGAYGAGGSAA